MLTKRARDFEGKRVRLTRSGLGVVQSRRGEAPKVVRRTAEGDTGTIINVSDAGFNGLVFRIRMDSHGDHVQAYESGDVEVIG